MTIYEVPYCAGCRAKIPFVYEGDLSNDRREHDSHEGWCEIPTPCVRTAWLWNGPGEYIERSLLLAETRKAEESKT